jgi:clan AA aspartic protease
VITGAVSPRRQPLVRLVIRGPNGREETIEAMVDSGFNGTMTLPAAVIARLELPLRRTEYATLADNRVVDIASHMGRVLWEGVERPVRILAAGEQPLLGMAMLVGYELRIAMVDGGPVTISLL